ncbi:hypothetical protein HPP92_023379 [Vanilla planifolia]|uniref:MYND-type domain-containing protein n=1 Tax=Vanilla planifolia TaxID=51239 RepID=A0A835PVD6_VANPL|nr:hypothetical protein HPP92_023379 [Vanilla planifolia]
MGQPQLKRGLVGRLVVGPRKRARVSSEERVDFFDGLPDDLIVLILSKLSASANYPADLINVLLVSRRFNGIATHPAVLARLSLMGMAVRAKNWTKAAHRFLKRCADSGSLNACYTLGMICFYCLDKREIGASLMAKAAMSSHAEALYSLAVIQFNGSGGTKSDKDLRSGVVLCARAAFYGHINALRELGHCLQDGYGVRQNIAEGRRFLVQANAWELARVLTRKERKASTTASFMKLQVGNGGLGVSSCSLLSDYGCNVPTPEWHPVNRFMVEWFAARGDVESGGEARGEGGERLRLCSNTGCGRPETRRHEFRRCSVCGAVNYCSRACQALHWKMAHKMECMPTDRWLNDHADPAAAVPPGGAPPDVANRVEDVN